jgi:hypothetical protein
MADRTDDASASNGSASSDSARSAIGRGDRYKWVALSNTTAAVFMSALDGNARKSTSLPAGQDAKTPHDPRSPSHIRSGSVVIRLSHSVRRIVRFPIATT